MRLKYVSVTLLGHVIWTSKASWTAHSPKEWSLLELPDPTLHMSEFEQVFGASDDENDEFPLSFKVGHHG